MPNPSLTSDQRLTRLAETPPRVAALTVGRASAHVQICPAPDEWFANEVLAHLRDLPPRLVQVVG